MPPDPGVLHSTSFAKYAVAFLRNTRTLLQGEPELGSPTAKLLDDALPILLLVVVGARILILRTEAHRVVEQYGNLARGGGNSFGLANTRRQTPVEGAERTVGTPNGDRCQAQQRHRPIGGLSSVRRQDFATADFAARRQRQPRGKVLGRWPATQVGPAFAHQAQR